MATLSTWFSDSDAAKWNYNCNRNFQANSWIFPLAVLPLWPVPEETLLGSFHWWSNEEIPILTLRVRSFYMERDHSKEPQPENHLFFLCKLVCCVSPWVVDQSRSGGRSMRPLGLYFRTVISVSWYFLCGGNGSIETFSSEEGPSWCGPKLELWDLVHRTDSIMDTLRC